MNSARTYLVVHPGAELFGSDRMMVESVRGLREGGTRVIVALPQDGPVIDELRAAGAEVVLLPMLVLRKALLRPSGWGSFAAGALKGAAAAWRLLVRQRPDAVYVSTITLPQWPVIARARRVPVVVHVHEAEASASRLISVGLYAPLLAARRIIVNSDFSRRTLGSALPRLLSRAEVVMNGVAGPPAITPARASVPDPRLLYVGRLSPRKGVHDAIAAVATLRRNGVPASLTILGSVFSGYEWYEAELRAAGAALGDDAVRFLGFQSDVWPILADHDVLVVPSVLDEPFGNTAVEGILAGRPVIATDTSGLREAAGDYQTTFLVPPSDPEGIANAVKNLVARWDVVSAALDESAAEAVDRHSPEFYRQRVRAAVDAR